MIEDEYGRYLDPAEPVHVTRDGQEIPLNQLTDSHLLNIMSYHHKRANEGIIKGSTWGGDVYADVIKGEEVLSRLDHYLYVCEAVRRGLKKPCACKCDEEEA